MAIAMRTFGNTLSDLQAGTNADKGLDYQRANLQDQVNQQRLEAFLKLRGQQLEQQAKQSQMAAERAQRMAELLQQNKQFDTEQRNRMDLGRLNSETQKSIAESDARSRLDAAKATAEGRFDPRGMQALADIEALNQENLQKTRYAQQLSDARKAAIATRNKIKADQGFFDVGQPNDARWAEINDAITKLDAQAVQLGIAPSPDGGYVVPGYVPIIVPNARGSVSAPVVSPSPAPEIPAMFNGGQFRGAGGGASWGEPVIPLPVQPAPRSTNRFRWDPSANDFMP